MTKEEQMLLRHLKDLSDTAYMQYYTNYSDFLNMNEQSVFLSHSSEFKNVHYQLIGGRTQAERQVVAFYNEDLLPAEVPIYCLCIETLYPKFSERLTHRDYLGSILGLGIDRCKVGDILVYEHKAYVFVKDSIADFVINSLTMVKHTQVRTYKEELPQDLHEPRFKVIRGSIASTRLDAVIAFAYHLPRTAAIKEISAKQVFVNGKLNENNSYMLKDQDVISVRHKGKFIFCDLLSTSKKNKCIVEVHLYV